MATTDEQKQVEKATVSGGGPDAIENRRRQVSHEYASAHDLLDKLGVPRRNPGKSRWLKLTERIKRLQQHEGEPDSDTPTPAQQDKETS